MEDNLVRFRRVMATILVGMLVGAFAGVVLMLTVVTLDLLVWLAAITVGAVGGGLLGVCVILWYPRGWSMNDKDAKIR